MVLLHWFESDVFGFSAGFIWSYIVVVLWEARRRRQVLARLDGMEAERVAVRLEALSSVYSQDAAADVASAADDVGVRQGEPVVWSDGGYFV